MTLLTRRCYAQGGSCFIDAQRRSYSTAKANRSTPYWRDIGRGGLAERALLSYSLAAQQAFDFVAYAECRELCQSGLAELSRIPVAIDTEAVEMTLQRNLGAVIQLTLGHGHSAAEKPLLRAELLAQGAAEPRALMLLHLRLNVFYSA